MLFWPGNISHIVILPLNTYNILQQQLHALAARDKLLWHIGQQAYCMYVDYILILDILVHVRNRNVEQVKRPKRAVACLQTLLDPCIQLN